MVYITDYYNWKRIYSANGISRSFWSKQICYHRTYKNNGFKLKKRNLKPKFTTLKLLCSSSQSLGEKCYFSWFRNTGVKNNSRSWVIYTMQIWVYYIKKHSYKYMQCARERLYLNSKHWVKHYRDIPLYTCRPRGYYFTGACLCLRPWTMAVTRVITYML